MTCLLVVAGSVSTPIATAETAPGDPIALVGEVTGGSVDETRLEVLVWPWDDIERQVQVGDTVPTHQLPSSAVTVEGPNFTVRMSPSDIPPEFMNDNGRVDIDVMIFEPGRKLVGEVSKTVSLLRGTETGDVKWVDASSAIAQGDEPLPAGAADADSELGPANVVVDVMHPTESEAEAVSQEACNTGWNLKVNSDRPAKIGHTFVPEGTASTGWAYHSNSRSHTMGVATSAGGGAWRANSSSRTFASGVNFTWQKNGATARAYRVETRYGRYRYEWESGGACFTNYDEKWQARYNTGCYTNKTWTVQPTWGRDYCVPVDAGIWKRERTDGSDFSLSGGVDLQSVANVNVSSKRSYASSAYIAYDVGGSSKKLCGSNRVAGYARDVRMAKTW